MATHTEFLRGCSVLVTGGTGSFGRAILGRLLETEVAQVRVFSRDEAKQDAMRESIGDERVEYVTGDIRDPDSVTSAMRGVHFVFHAAALKQVPNCERFPMEAVKTNVLGASNVVAAARACEPLSLVAISTDKAVEPLNTMGLSKALMERIVLGGADKRHQTRMLCVRYGNVIGSRGSVVPLFLKCIDEGRPLPITDPDMTRFLLRLDDAVDLVLDAARVGYSGELWVRKMPAATVATIAEACQKFRGRGADTKLVGVRPGEKKHEVLVSADEMVRAEDLPLHFLIKREPVSGTRAEYTSEVTERLDADGVVDLLGSAGGL